MAKEKRLKHRVRNPTDPDLKKSAKSAPEPKPATPESEPEPEPKPITPEIEPEPQPEAQRHNMKPLDPEMSKKFAGRLDRLLCVLTTAALKRSRPTFELQVEEISAIEFGESIIDLVNYYLPQLDTSSPWPPFVMAAIGVSAVIGSKLSEAPKAKAPGKTITQAPAQPAQQATPAPQKKPQPEPKPAAPEPKPEQPAKPEPKKKSLKKKAKK